MTDKKIFILNLSHYGISPWELEVIYELLNWRFQIKMTQINQTDNNFSSILDISIPLPFNEKFFNWLGFGRWDGIKSIFKEIKRRRGNSSYIKIVLGFTSPYKIRFIVDAKNKHNFNTAVEKISFVIELLPYHLEVKKLPHDITKIFYTFNVDKMRWVPNIITLYKKRLVFIDNIWKSVI